MASYGIAVVDDIHFFVNDSGYIGAIVEAHCGKEIKFDRMLNTAEFLKRDIRIGDHLMLDRNGVLTRKVDLEARDGTREIVQLPDHCPECGTFLELEMERKPQLKCPRCASNALIVDIAGDIFLDSAEGDVVCIPVNTVGTAGKGLALHMRLNYPETYKKYLKACKRGRIATGEPTVVYENGRRLALVPTKYEWRNPSDPQLIEISLVRLKKYLKDNGIENCHIPRLGCGETTGRLDYESVVKPLIRKVFANSGIRVTVYEWSR